MKKIKIIFAALLSVCVLISTAACGEKNEKISIEKPKNISTVDEAELTADAAAVEPSDNVNGMRFTLTLYEFTERYNAIKRMLGDTDLIIAGNWRENGEVTTDNNGVRVQYYYYDDYNVNITATVETECEKLLNIGCGTTMSNFMAQEGGKNNSDLVLRKAALMAQAACQFDESSVDTLQNIFYKTTTESNDSIWFQGFIFSLSTQEDKKDSKNSIMLFRVFPVSDNLKEEWKTVEYEE